MKCRSVEINQASLPIKTTRCSKLVSVTCPRSKYQRPPQSTMIRGEEVLTRRKNMLKRRQLAGANLIDDTSNRVFRCDVCLGDRDSITGSNVVEYLLDACLITNNSNDFTLSLEGTDNGRYPDVSGCTEDKDRFCHCYSEQKGRLRSIPKSGRDGLSQQHGRGFGTPLY